MPQLKAFDERKQYDSTKAEQRRSAIQSTRIEDQFQHFLNERGVFTKMLDLLVELTPELLKSALTIENSEALASVVVEQERQYRSTRYSTPRYLMTELPHMPPPDDAAKFREYIYYLTHTKVLYRNLSLLTSGIVPEILLHTHHLENSTYKNVRSTTTYNYLIKYFGYDKFQSSFARELLLVMSKDGHHPNIETVNQLLKACRIHSRRRRLTSTYHVILSYLTLAKRLDLRADLTTWYRVYDCIDNIFLKETFANKMALINLPISEAMCLRIVQDFASTSSKTSELVEFVERDLRRDPTEPRIGDIIMTHKVRKLRDCGEFSRIWRELPLCSDPLTVKNLASAVAGNRYLKHKTPLLLGILLHFKKQPVEILPEVVGLLLKTAVTEKVSSKILRGLLYEGMKALRLEEWTHKRCKKKIQVPGFPVLVPKPKLHESYRILKRLTQNRLTEAEARAILAIDSGNRERYLWDPLSAEEAAWWAEFCETHMHEFWLREWPAECWPADVVAAFVRFNNTRKGINRDSRTVQRVAAGFDHHLKADINGRGIGIASPQDDQKLSSQASLENDFFLDSSNSGEIVKLRGILDDDVLMFPELACLTLGTTTARGAKM